MYKCNKCGIIFDEEHKEFECREELLYNITQII